MNKILKMLFAGALVAMGCASCETYDVDDPDMTAVADLDGQWICFAYESSAPDTPVTVFDILVTNTTDNAADAMWMTIADCDYSASGNPRYLDALQFKLSCDNSAQTFSCTSAEAVQPRTCHNIYLGQGYYTAGYAGAVASQGYTVTVTGGKVTKNGVDTKTGYKAVRLHAHESGRLDGQLYRQRHEKHRLGRGYERLQRFHRCELLERTEHFLP